jgi:hypothetical protein
MQLVYYLSIWTPILNVDSDSDSEIRGTSSGRKSVGEAIKQETVQTKIEDGGFIFKKYDGVESLNDLSTWIMNAPTKVFFSNVDDSLM